MSCCEYPFLPFIAVSPVGVRAGRIGASQPVGRLDGLTAARPTKTAVFGKMGKKD
jgi:hypothetical protein